jgi:cell division protein FtsL
MGETMRRSDSGKSTVKAVLSIAFVFAVAYSAIKIIPVYVSSYELQDYIRQQNPFWVTQRTPADAIRNHILAKAKDLDLPVEPDQVKVEVGGGVSVQLDYTVPVNLKVYTLNLHFTPSADNRQL